MGIGIFLCTCNNTSSIDFREVNRSIKKEVEVVEVHDLLCQADGLSYIIDDIRRKEIDAIIIGCTFKKRIFEELVGGAGFEGNDVTLLNLRENCGWVHDKKGATEKAKRLILAAINRIMTRPRTERFVIDVGYDVLVIGDSNLGISIAKSLSNFANVQLLMKTGLGLTSLEDVLVHIGSVKDVKGVLGSFSVEIVKGKIDTKRCIICGFCDNICKKNAIQSGLVYSINDLCNGCGECIDVCPTAAIDLSYKNETLKAGQVLVIGDWKYPVIEGIHLCGDDPQSALLNVISNLGKIKKQRALDLNLENCAAGKSEKIGCEICEIACPNVAITRDGDSISFEEIACNACGTCSAICPISLPQMRECSDDVIYSQMEVLLSKKKKDVDLKVLMFACSECESTLESVGRKRLQYPPLLPLFVSCADAVSEAHILRAFDLGADGVILLRCEDCQNDVLAGGLALKFANTALAAFDLGERVRQMKGYSGEPDLFVSAVTDFVQGLSPSPIRNKKPTKLDKTAKRNVILSLVHALSVKTGISPNFVEEDTLFPFADITVSEKCTICNACMNMCPMNAIIRRDNRVDFIYGYCISCGLCEKACPEGALKLKKVLDFAKLVEPKEINLAESDLIKCEECGKPFITHAAFNRASNLIRGSEGKDEFSTEERLGLMKYCEDCRAVRALKRVLETIK
ncbi:MAG: hydrogenase iron-sulfur subunit [Methanocellales archaeon]|nr:hydrogenase iron-sulfur subunit [Methanocellales archaeon]